MRALVFAILFAGALMVGFSEPASAAGAEVECELTVSLSAGTQDPPAMVTQAFSCVTNVFIP